MRKINIHPLALICLIKLKLGLTPDKQSIYCNAPVIKKNRKACPAFHITQEIVN